MPDTIYCWRCQMNIPMLTEEEWALVKPHLENAVEQIKDFGAKALMQYKQLTCFDETNPDALFHHRLSLYGPLCRKCGRPLRTPKAKHCASCGTARDDELVCEP